MILLDYSQICISNIMQELQGRTDVELNVPMVRHMIVNSILGYKKKFGNEFGDMIIACDSKNYWRKKAFPNYKVNRKKSRAASGLDWASIYECINLVKEELETHLPYSVVTVDQAEADDVIGALVMWAQTHELVKATGLINAHPQPIMIVSGDGDFAQLLKYQDVRQYNPTLKKMIFVSQDPHYTLMEKVIKGDKGDGVPCFLNDDDSLKNGERMKSIYETKLAVWKTQTIDEIASDPTLLKIYPQTFLQRNLERNNLLVNLENIPQDLQDDIVQNYLNQRGARNRSKLNEYFTQHNMKQMMERLSEF